MVPLNDHSTKVWSICPSSFREKIFNHYPNRVYVKTTVCQQLSCMHVRDIGYKSTRRQWKVHSTKVLPQLAMQLQRRLVNFFLSIYCIHVLESSFTIEHCGIQSWLEKILLYSQIFSKVAYSHFVQQKLQKRLSRKLLFDLCLNLNA